MVDYLKIGKATELSGKDRSLYRALEILPGFLSWGTILGLLVLSYFVPVWVAYFIILFDIYWLLLVFYLGVHLIISFRRVQKNRKVNWLEQCRALSRQELSDDLPADALALKRITYQDIKHLIIIPFVLEGDDVLEPTLGAIAQDDYPQENLMIVLATEERAGEEAQVTARKMKEKFGHLFAKFIITIHPDGIDGELKGKGANQAWAARVAQADIIQAEQLDTDKLLVSVFDSDTIISRGYFARLTYLFLTVTDPYRASYQPVPFYHNNVWDVKFFSRVGAASNTFWQMMQQIRIEKLATYSSHSMTWKALADVGFWSTGMVSEDSRIFWHCFCYYQGEYRVEPMYFPVSMDSIKIESAVKTLTGLYAQQRRWGWGVENLPYLLFNTIKCWKNIPKKKFIDRNMVQIYGFHSWATNALIIGVIGWMPLLLGGDKFNATVLSGNLPFVTRTLMMFAMSGLLVSAIVATLLLPPRPRDYGIFKRLLVFVEWILLPLGIIFFGALPALDAQTRLMFGKYMGFLVTPKGTKPRYEPKDKNAAV